MEIKKYEDQICNIDLDLLKNDEYCFFVLSRILQGRCRLTITDNKRIIICHSCEPYPVWVWLPDDASLDETEFAYRIIKENFGLDGRYRFNVKYELAHFLIDRAAKDGYAVEIETNMLTYNCKFPISPKKAAGGYCREAVIEDAEAAAECINEFHYDVGADKLDMDGCLRKAKDLIEEHRLYFWYDENGEKAAMASYGILGDKGSICNVFTKHDKRRRGYASNLVYAVTLIVKNQGKIPILYTDADYEASNACYTGIGYVKQGSLCTLN